MSHLVGRQLGRYLIEQEIGRGGMARVYRATDISLQRQVALKILAPQLNVDPEFARRFEREAVTAANLRHPAIVTVYDVGEQENLRYIAMEYIHGRTLHAILEQYGALGLEYAIPLLAPICQALDYAHSQGAVHRDVKPHNIMVDVDGRVLLTDFGIVQAQEPEGERLTRTGIFMGTPEYMSPEQADARRVDGRSDLYSLGIVAYEIITGRVPFTGGTPQLIVAHAQAQPPPPSSLVRYLPSELDKIMARALAKHPRSRFESAAALLTALNIVARQSGLTLAGTDQIAHLAEPGSPDQEPTRSISGRTPVSNAPPPALQQPPARSRPLAPLAPPRLWRPRRAPAIVVASLLITLGITAALVFFRGNATVSVTTPTPALSVNEASASPVSSTPVLALPSVTPTVSEPVVASPGPTQLSPSPVPPTATAEPPTAAPPTRVPPSPVPPTGVPPSPVPPTATAELPTATAEPPTATAEPPTATAEPPTATAEPPTATAEPPSPSPVLGTPIPLTPEIGGG